MFMDLDEGFKIVLRLEFIEFELRDGVVLLNVCLLYEGDVLCLSVGARLYRKLQVYLMTEDQLQEHGYPRTSPEASGRAVIYNLPEKKPASDREAPRRFPFPSVSINVLYLFSD